MAVRRLGKRHQLLYYRRMMDRLWLATLVLGMVMFGVWFGAGRFFIELQRPFDIIVLAGAATVTAFALFAFLVRKMAYVQAATDHLRVVTPFLRLKISYRRLRTTHPAEFHQLFPPQKAKWAQRKFLEPFYGKTVLLVELTAFPIKQGLLRLYLPPTMFSPQSKGLVFVVKDWMALSTEIDSYHGSWRQGGGTHTRPRTPSPYGILQSVKKK